MMCGRWFRDQREVSNDFQMDLQDQACCRWQHREVQARFVARVFSQKEGEYYDEIFSPIARYTSIRSIISIAFVMGWKLHQMDVKIALLNGVIEEEVYIEKP